MITQFCKKVFKSKRGPGSSTPGASEGPKNGGGAVIDCFLLLLPSFLFWQNLEGGGAGPSGPSGTPAESNVGVAPSHIIRSVNVQF